MLLERFRKKLTSCEQLAVNLLPALAQRLPDLLECLVFHVTLEHKALRLFWKSCEASVEILLCFLVG